MMDISFTVHPEAIAKIEKLGLLVRTQVADKCLTAMARPVLQKAKSIAPSSKVPQSGNKTKGPTRDKWSKKTANNEQWSGVDSGKHIGKKLFRTAKGGIVFVGYQHPKGNKAQFNNLKKKETRNAKYWGRQGKPYRPQYVVMVRAFDETKSEQLAAFNTTFENEVRNINLG